MDSVQYYRNREVFKDTMIVCASNPILAESIERSIASQEIIPEDQYIDSIPNV